MTRKNVSRDDFVRAWESNSGDATRVANQLGVKRQTVVIRASKLRKMGVPLCKPAVQRGNKPIDQDEIARLAALISEIRVDEAGSVEATDEVETVDTIA